MAMDRNLEPVSREFIAAGLLEWLSEQAVQPAFIEKGSPHQNTFVERFNGSMRGELLNSEEFGPPPA